MRESAKLMLSVDKELKLFAAATSDKNWTLPLLREAGRHLDYISIHGYWDPLFHHNNPAPYLDCMMRTDAPEKDIQRTIEILEAGFGGGRIKIAYDEWNLKNCITRGTATSVADSIWRPDARMISPHNTRWPMPCSRLASSTPVCAIPTSWRSPVSRLS